ncbi:HutD family protein [Streptomyces sp. NPDC005423]|uniref:HutD/Ves family protein n=1 Tax=Streptomyces sp. NPDC005423 TaxID=3155343 RepID=UPI0033BCB020
MIRFLPAAARTAVPWKNGGGVTREIAVSPEGAGLDDFRWRVSLAEVGADGPFSAFPGVDRNLMVVEGAGLELTVGGERGLVDSRYVPGEFRGDLPTEGRLLDGPVVNLNVMWRRGDGRTAPTVAVVCGRLPLLADALVVALDGPAEVAGLTLGPYDAALLTGEERVLHARGRCAVIGLGAAAHRKLTSGDHRP